MYRWAVIVACLSILLALGSWVARAGAAAPGPGAPATSAPASAISQDSTPTTPQPAPIPEPATLAFLGVGNLALLAIRRRHAGR